MALNIALYKQKASGRKKVHRKLFQDLKKCKPAVTDALFHEEHERVFNYIHCLECANCCQTTGPLFTPKDIERIAAFLRLKPGDFFKQYLRTDEDGDTVFITMPCPFLQKDLYCRIYDVRPQACREYPHTNRKNMSEILPLTFTNIAVCPAVYEITENILKKIPSKI